MNIYWPRRGTLLLLVGLSFHFCNIVVDGSVPSFDRSIFVRHDEVRGNNTYVFTNPLTGTCYSRQSAMMKNMFIKLCAQAGIKPFTAHCLRHYVASFIKDPRRAQKVLGHMNLKTTEIYLHELEVDYGVADIFDNMTKVIAQNFAHETTNRKTDTHYSIGLSVWKSQ